MASWQRITSCVFHFLTSSREKNLVNQAAVFCVKNALKLTSDHLRLEKIFRGLYPGPPRGGEREGERKKGRGGATAPPKMFVCPRPCLRNRTNENRLNGLIAHMHFNSAVAVDVQDVIDRFASMKKRRIILI
jgi:hypothetical protein